MADRGTLPTLPLAARLAILSCLAVLALAGWLAHGLDWEWR